MSERYKCVYVDKNGNFRDDKFIRNYRPFHMKKCFIDSVSELSNELYKKYSDSNFQKINLTKDEIYDEIMNKFYKNCNATDLNLDILQLDGIYFIDFKDEKIYYGWKDYEKLQPEMDQYYKAMHDVEGYYYDSNNQNFKELKKIADEKENKLYNKIDQILSPEINGFPNYYNLIEKKIAVYDFSGDIQDSECLYFTNSNDNTLNRIAKKLIAGNTYDKIDEKTLKHFQGFLKNELGYRWEIYSHDGLSYDGFMSFTEGYVEAVTSYTGWDEMELFPEDFDKNYEYCKESFYMDNSELFEGKSKEQAMKILEQSISNQDYNNDEIWNEYEKYESDWMCEESGSLFVAIQFYANGESYNTQSWTCSIYAGKGDTYGRRQKYLYEDSIDFKDINEPGIINQIESKIRSAIEKSSFDSLD